MFSGGVTIRSKLVFAALVSAALLIVLAGLSFFGQQKANDAFERVRNGAVAPLLNITDIDAGLKEVRFHMAAYTVGGISNNGARAKLKEVREKIPLEWREFMASFDAKTASEDERSAVTSIDKALGDLPPIFDALDAAYSKEDRDAVSDILNGQWPRMVKGITRPLSELLVPARVAYMNQTFDQTQTEGRHLVSMALVGNLLGLVVLALIMIPLVRSIARSIDEMRGVLVKIAGGDLSVDADTRRGDELGDMARSLAQTMESLRELIGGAISSSDAVVRESEVMRSDAESLAKTAETQSLATSAIAAAVEQLTVSIGVMSENAQDAGRLSLESEKRAHESQQIVSAAINTIQKVADGMTEAAGTMDELSNKVASIDNIVQTIHDIADQTNLLALNAAIEAARAGEQGRGFAVVADEVRKLAERTTLSTQEISGIVGGVSQTTGRALDTMANAKGLAEEGARHTAEIRAAMQGMDQSSSEARRSVESIANALQEQTAASTDIAQRVELIAQGIDRTHAASTESKQRSAMLVELSLKLKEGVRRFHI